MRQLMTSRLTRNQPVRRLVLEARLFNRKLSRHWKNYLIHCGMAALALLLVLSVIDVVLQAAIVVAIASTAFIVFVRPHGRGSGPRRVIGGHLVAMAHEGTSLTALQRRLPGIWCMDVMVQRSIGVVDLRPPVLQRGA